MDGLGEQNTALQMKPRSMVEEEVPAGEVAAQREELSGEGKEKSKGIQSHKRVESATAPATLTATPQTEKEPMNNATATPTVNRDPAQAKAKREIERLLQDNQKERAVLADRYKKKIDFLEEEIERLTDRGASDRLIEKKEREICALIADYNRRVAPLLKR